MHPSVITAMVARHERPVQSPGGAAGVSGRRRFLLKRAGSLKTATKWLDAAEKASTRGREDNGFRCGWRAAGCSGLAARGWAALPAALLAASNSCGAEGPA